MSKSQRLRLDEVRASMRLVGECRDLGYDPEAWRRRALEGLSRMDGALFANGGEIHWPRSEGSMTVIHSVEIGSSKASAPDPDLTEGEGDAETEPTCEAIKAIRGDPGQLLTRVRRQLIPDREWYRTAHYLKYHRPAGIDHHVVSFWEMTGDRVDVIGLHRYTGDRDFTERELNQLQLFHAELARLIGPVLVSPDDRFSPTRLPPRVRETLQCLQEGDSEKQAAARMGLSVPTVHQYVTALYRHYQVSSRAELLARVLRRSNQTR
jgi:DNA-binding CsgD family transcriptional regulator